jgi:hypothetical protein
MSAEKQSYRGLAWTSWVLVVSFLILAVIPFLGFLVWPIMLIVVILAIIILTRGGTAQGIFLILISVFVLPFWAFLAPIVSSAIVTPPVEDHEDPGIDDLMEGIEVPLNPDALPDEIPTE